MADKPEKIFAKGVIAFTPTDKQKEYKMIPLVINIDEFNNWLKETPNVITEYSKKRQVKLLIRTTKDGKHYVEVDTFVAKGQKPQTKIEKPKEEEENWNATVDDGTEIPF